MNNTQKKRTRVVMIILAVCAVALLILYGILMTRKPPVEGGRSAHVERGPIVDRNGRLLAIETRFAEVDIDMKKVKKSNIGELAAELSPIIDMSAAEIKNKIESYSGKSQFLRLKTRLHESVIETIEKAHKKNRLTEVSAEEFWGRIYPEKNLASQIVGLVTDDHQHNEGIEGAFEAELGGTKEYTKGSTVVLTIDVNVQHILERISEKTMNETRAEAVMFLAMDPRNGDILGAASLPNFDPNNFGTATQARKSFRPSTEEYEPGSVFKIFSLASLLEAGAVTGNSVFVCNGSYVQTTNRGERWSITCADGIAHGNVSPREIILYSCNVGISQASERIDKQGFYDRLRNFGFGEKVNLVDKLWENSGKLWPLENWSDRTKATLAIGQEASVSAIQVLKAASAIANDGEMVSPRLVSRIIRPDGESVEYREGSERRRIFSERTARTMREYMKGVTSEIGTGWRANIEDISLAVKTGTAQYVIPGTGKYSDVDFVSSCIALLPADSPTLILYVVIIKARGETYGGRIAAPAIREAAEDLINYFGIVRGQNYEIPHSGSVTIPPISYPVVGRTVPNFYLYSKRALLPLLERENFTVEIRGEGWVRHQAPPPGTPVTADTVIILELE